MKLTITAKHEKSEIQITEIEAPDVLTALRILVSQLDLALPYHVPVSQVAFYFDDQVDYLRPSDT